MKALTALTRVGNKCGIIVNLSIKNPLSISIIGAGLMGRLLCWRLLLQGHKVQLIEQSSFDRPVSAAHTAAAMISPMSEVVVSERAIYDMGVESLKIWPKWLAELDASTQLKTPYQAPGSIVVAHPADEAELQQFYMDLAHHLGDDNCARWLDHSELRKVEPDVAGTFSKALFLPNEAYLDNRTLLNNLLIAIRERGGHCIDQVRVETNSELQCRQPNIHLEQSDLIIDCRGVGARDHCKDLRGVRGEVLWVQTQEVVFRHPIRLMHPRYKLYIVPKPNNGYIIGATEIESQDRSPVTVQSTLELCSALYTLHPAFAEARITELDANLRPAFWDNMPRIQWSQIRCKNNIVPLVQVNGLYRHGYLLAPFLAEQVLSELNHSCIHPTTSSLYDNLNQHQQ